MSCGYAKKIATFFALGVVLVVIRSDFLAG